MDKHNDTYIFNRIKLTRVPCKKTQKKHIYITNLMFFSKVSLFGFRTILYEDIQFYN